MLDVAPSGDPGQRLGDMDGDDELVQSADDSRGATRFLQPLYPRSPYRLLYINPSQAHTVEGGAGGVGRGVEMERKERREGGGRRTGSGFSRCVSC